MSRRNPLKAQRKRTAKNQRNHTAEKRKNKESLVAMLDWFLADDSIFAKMEMHGNTKWLPKCLVFLAIMWAWSEHKCVTDSYAEALDCCRSMFSSFIPTTYQGFMGALTRWTPTLMSILWPILHARMKAIGGKCWRIGEWVPIAFDGSRSTASRSKANETAFCAKNYGKGKTAKYRKKKSKGMRRKKNQKNKAQPQEPQAWITMMWHMGLRLPWQWRLGPSNSSERAHVLEMIAQGKFPRNTLFVGDAGFVGYPLWSAIRNNHGHFLVRVGGNVSLLSEDADFEFVKGGLVLCWPKAEQAKQPPLRLRLIKVKIGKTPMYMLTSVLDEEKLTRKQIARFYEMRWGIEVEFRGLKQTLDRAKLRCRNDKRFLAELDWSIMGMAVAELFASKEQLAKPRPKSRADVHPRDAAKRSLANTMRALRSCMRKLDQVPAPGENLSTLLQEALTDSYQRKSSKKARYRPPNPDKKPLGEPTIRKLTAQETDKLATREEKLVV